MTTPTFKGHYDNAQFEEVVDPNEPQGYTVEEAYAVLAELPLPPVAVEPVET